MASTAALAGLAASVVVAAQAMVATLAAKAAFATVADALKLVVCVWTGQQGWLGLVCLVWIGLGQNRMCRQGILKGEVSLYH